MIVLSGAALVVAAVLLAVGVVGPTACVYASLALIFLAAGVLPLGAARRVRHAEARGPVSS
ncbi:hypothetical protein BL253_13380 [Pseudofrankia asymbiotica]|uniref:Uncharacterized protein n=1 Tax=Pseudofrankia asymbiotica TaxID=1834516 RepID=A0A1V2IBU7_9ACTN|nr:hypothetical protein BL253_13380 [Pseudofrankia asymbiotica]